MLLNPEISIISPVYGAENIIEELIIQIQSSVGKITENYEIILVDDCGPDNSWLKIKSECSKDIRVKGIKLSRNFGQHYAITAGIETAKGNYIVVMDCDLQDDPKYIPDMYNKIKDGFDIIYTIKESREHSIIKNFFAGIFNFFFNYLSDNKRITSHSNIGAYSMISRKVALAFNNFNDYHRHYLMVLRWLGFKSYYLNIKHKERFSGKSGYTFSKLVLHAIDGITSQSNKILSLFINAGLILSLISFLSVIIIIIRYFQHGFLSGWASLIIAILFSTGIILIGIGLLGLYIGKTFEQSKNRPKFVIDEFINL